MSEPFREPASQEPAEVRFKQLIYADARLYGLTESGEVYQGYWSGNKFDKWYRLPMIIAENK